MPSTVDTSMYLSIISWEFFMSTSTDKLVNFPVLDWVVLMTAPMQSKALATVAIFSGSVGTINLNKYSEGKAVFMSNSTLSRSKNSAVFWDFSQSWALIVAHFFNSKIVCLSLPITAAK